MTLHLGCPLRAATPRSFLTRHSPVTSPNREQCWGCKHTPGVGAPVHGVDLGQVAPQRPPGTHLDSSHGVDVVCDLKKKSSCNQPCDDAIAHLLHTYPTGGTTALTVPTPVLPATQAALHPWGRAFTTAPTFLSWFSLSLLLYLVIRTICVSLSVPPCDRHTAGPQGQEPLPP